MVLRATIASVDRWYASNARNITYTGLGGAEGRHARNAGNAGHIYLINSYVPTCGRGPGDTALQPLVLLCFAR